MSRILRPAPAVVGALLALSALVTAGAPTARADGGCHFAAIAYSEQTGRFGYVNGADCLPDAEQRAVTNCGACDARVVVWVQNGWVALARGGNGAYGYSCSNCSLQEAEVNAVGNCAPRGCGARVVLWAYSL